MVKNKVRRPAAAIFALRQKNKEHLTKEEMEKLYEYIEFLEYTNKKLQSGIDCRNLWKKWNN